MIMNSILFLLALILSYGINSSDINRLIICHVWSNDCESTYKCSSRCSLLIAVLIIAGLIVTTILFKTNVLLLCISALLAFVTAIASLWLITKVALRNKNAAIILAVTLICISSYLANFVLLPKAILFAAVIGFYYRNNVFGTPWNLPLHRLYAKHSINGFPKPLLPEIITIKIPQKMPDFSYVGIQKTFAKSNVVVDVTTKGVMPNKKTDCLPLVQALVDELGKNGGGSIFFPAGRYYFNYGKKKNNQFLQINYSNIEIYGETSSTGKNLVTIVSCANLVYNKRAPWLSPFIITTGETLQQSNMPWGADFKKKEKVFVQGGALTDPGNDGKMGKPEFYCHVVADAKVGDTTLLIETTTIDTPKYILLCMYNTTADCNLTKDILQRNELRPEWKTLLRGGKEMAPSFQWLVEVDRIEGNIIHLAQPLRRNIDVKYQPEAFSVPMLENICIHNLNMTTEWEGIFRHHGFPVYYSVFESQTMDYGWGAINLKRAAHSRIYEINLENFNNAFYILDSKNTTIERVNIFGYDGHQGIKIYNHSADNLLRDIDFYNHYADMIGGEGCSIANVFSNIRYLNPNNKYVDFDFHGVSSGPFTPPTLTLYYSIYGFRGIKAGGTQYNQPACSVDNYWVNIHADGYNGTTEVFINDSYIRKEGVQRIVTSLRYAIVKCIQKKKIGLSVIQQYYKERMSAIDKTTLLRKDHYQLFKGSVLAGYNNYYPMTLGGKTVDEFDDTEMVTWIK